MKLLVVDGIEETRKYYLELIEKCIPNASAYECVSAEDAFFQLHQHNAELIICSEILSFRSGYDLTCLVRKVMPHVPVIIVATDQTHALDAIKTKVFDYLVQPFTESDFNTSLIKAISFIAEHKEEMEKGEVGEKVWVKIGQNKGYKLVDLDRIAYFMAEGPYSNIYYTNGETDFSGYYLGKIEENISKYHFTRINRSVLVNLKQIRHIDKGEEQCVVEVGNELKTFKMTKGALQKLHADKII